MPSAGDHSSAASPSRCLFPLGPKRVWVTSGSPGHAEDGQRCTVVRGASKWIPEWIPDRILDWIPDRRRRWQLAQQTAIRPFAISRLGLLGVGPQIFPGNKRRNTLGRDELCRRDNP